MDPIPGFKFANWERGFGDVHLVPDLSSLRIAAWQHKSAMVFCDVYNNKTHELVHVAPRSILRCARALVFSILMVWIFCVAHTISLSLSFYASFCTSSLCLFFTFFLALFVTFCVALYFPCPIYHSKQIDAAQATGHKIMAASELEYFLFQTSYREAAEKHYTPALLRSVSTTVEDYHMLQTAREEPFNARARKMLKVLGAD